MPGLEWLGQPQALADGVCHLRGPSAPRTRGADIAVNYHEPTYPIPDMLGRCGSMLAAISAGSCFRGSKASIALRVCPG